MTKTFTIKREFEEEVIVIKPVFRDVEVDIENITHNDIMKMEFPMLRSYAMNARMLLKERSSIVVDPQPIVEPLVSDPQPKTTVPPREGDSGRNCGAKLGETSRYHYCYFDSKKGKFACSIRDKGMNKSIGCFSDEIDAALAADQYLDENNDQKRPRNRDEFPEIMELYLEVQL